MVEQLLTEEFEQRWKNSEEVDSTVGSKKCI